MKKDKSIFLNAVYIPVKDHPYLFLCLLFFTVLGIAAGVASMSSLSDIVGNDYFITAISAHPVINFKALLHQLLLNISLYLLLTLSGIWLPGIVFTIIGVILKGFFLGIGMFAYLHCYGTLGTVGILIALMLPEFGILMFLLNTALKSLQTWLLRTKTYFADNIPILTSADLRGICSGLTALLLLTTVSYFVSNIGSRLCDMIFDVASGR